MNRAGVKLSEVRELLLKDEAFRREYDRLRPRYEVISQMIEARRKLKITQTELAFRAGTQRSNISRLESGEYNPSLDFLVKVASSLDMEVQVTLRARDAVGTKAREVETPECHLTARPSDPSPDSR